MSWVNFNPASPPSHGAHIEQMAACAVTPTATVSSPQLWYGSACTQIDATGAHLAGPSFAQDPAAEHYHRQAHVGIMGERAPSQSYNAAEGDYVSDESAGTASGSRKSRRRRRVHIPHSQRPVEFVVRRNERERRRVGVINGYFQELQHLVPASHATEDVTRSSKAAIIRNAIDYIQSIHRFMGIPNFHEESGDPHGLQSCAYQYPRQWPQYVSGFHQPDADPQNEHQVSDDDSSADDAPTAVEQMAVEQANRNETIHINNEENGATESLGTADNDSVDRWGNGRSSRAIAHSN